MVWIEFILTISKMFWMSSNLCRPPGHGMTLMRAYLNKTEDVYHLNFQQDEDYVDCEEIEETESEDESKVSMTPKKRKFDDDSADDTPEGHVQPV